MEQERTTGLYSQASSVSAFSALLSKTYLWMTLGLAMTGLTAAYVANNVALMQSIFTGSSFMILIIAELALVWILSARIMKMSFMAAGLMFAAYSILNGATLSVIFLAYSPQVIATTFFITAGTFGAMASSALYWGVTYLGVLLFAGLTAYDTQKIKMMLMQYGGEVNNDTMKMALMGSLTLYLDFVNLFLFILRIVGGNRE